MIRVVLKDWWALAPGFADRRAFAAYLTGSGAAPPPEGRAETSGAGKLGRRMGPLGRLAVEAGLRCLKSAGIEPRDAPSVFASRWGEISMTADLFASLAAGEPLSPAIFSHSVHHAPAGFFGIAAENRLPARTVAAGEASFCCGFLDAAVLAGDRREQSVLLVAADLVPPEPFRSPADPDRPYAAAFLLKAAGEGDGFSFACGGEPSGARPNGELRGEPPFAFLAWMLSDREELKLTASGRTWRWTR